MWGAGSLTFGLTMRYLGMSLGQAVALGYTVSLGTLVIASNSCTIKAKCCSSNNAE
jgi:hypothetical protein